jgi:hypothetical protein
LIEATNRIRIIRSHIPLNSSPAHLSGIWGALVAHAGPFAGYSTYKCCLFFIRHSGPRLYPLTKSVGHQTSSMSCPRPYDAHKNIHWSKRETRWCVLRFCVSHRWDSDSDSGSQPETRGQRPGVPGDPTPGGTAGSGSSGCGLRSAAGLAPLSG